MSLSPQGNGPGKIGTAEIADGAVTNAKVNASAAIAKSKISSTGTWTAAEIPNLSATKITSDQLALARGGTGQDLSGKTVAVLEDAQTFTAQQTFDEDIETDAGLKLPHQLVKQFLYDAHSDSVFPMTFADINGTNTDSGIQDGIDGGRRITTGSSTNNRACYYNNNKRHFDPANCTIYGIIKRNGDNSLVEAGITNEAGFETGEWIYVRDYTAESFIITNTKDGNGSTKVTTDVAISTNDIPFKIVCSASDQKLYLLVSGVWTLKATQSTRLPVVAMQPAFQVNTTTTASRTGDLKKLVVMNDS